MVSKRRNGGDRLDVRGSLWISVGGDSLGGHGRVALLRAELGQARPLASPWIAYSEDTTRELAVLRAAAAGRDDGCENGEHSNTMTRNHDVSLSDVGTEARLPRAWGREAATAVRGCNKARVPRPRIPTLIFK